MVDSISEQLGEETACEELLRCLYGHTELDKTCLRMLDSSGESLTIDDITEAVEYNRSAVYRSIQRLLTTGFVEKEQVNYDEGGSYHVYSVSDPEKIVSDMHRILNDRHTTMDQLISGFERTYERAASSPVEK